MQRSRQETRLGGSTRRQLSGRDPKCGTTRALARVRELARTAPPAMSERVAALVVALGRKQELVATSAPRHSHQGAAWTSGSTFHVPLSFALLAALIAHVVAVFFYWG